MQILSHRGYWLNKNEKNSQIAFQRSFEAGFGSELDVRDYCGEIVISHDIAGPEALPFSEFLLSYLPYKDKLFLAVNIKSDGLCPKIVDMLKLHAISNYFVFDMSVPDALTYIACGMNVFTRESEYEVYPPYYDAACGVWMDELCSPWITEEKISLHLKNQKQVSIVSPELHNRDYIGAWLKYKKIACSIADNKLFLCTDFPEQARHYFHD